jgi:hypothetical protein
MIVQPQFLLHIKIENMMTRVYGYPMFGEKNCGNKKSQTDLSKLPHILLAIAIFMGKVYLRGSRRNLTAEPASPTTLERSLFLSLN